ncbi:MAG TPA: hypothetical protein VN823_14405 [Stellaceae bacterium]|nr:hypothetical protein [Stellaceae bacterium]
MRERSINAGLVLASLLLTYLVLDFGVLHHFIDHVPLRFNKFLGQAMIFGQSSKAGPIPHDYIAVFATPTPRTSATGFSRSAIAAIPTSRRRTCFTASSDGT